MNETGTVAGFHYGNEFKGCSGVLHWTDRVAPNGRQIALCDACGAECIPKAGVPLSPGWWRRGEETGDRELTEAERLGER